MSRPFPVWRSMLFVPAQVERFVARAHQRGADACILDLEDSVPLAQKAAARQALAAGARQVTQSGGAALVRLNHPRELLLDDLEAAVLPEVQALVLPKIDGAALVQDVAARLDQLETARGIEPTRIRLIAQIEDVRALPQLDAIAAASPRLLGMILGSEDFSASAGMAPVREALLWPNQQVAFACRRAGILPFGFPGSIADYGDLEAFRGTVRLARQLGFVGAFCIHPDQVAVLNQEFVPPPAEVEEARAVLAAYEAALREGRAAASHNGRMIDPPVVARAEEILHRARPPSHP